MEDRIHTKMVTFSLWVLVVTAFAQKVDKSLAVQIGTGIFRAQKFLPIFSSLHIYQVVMSSISSLNKSTLFIASYRALCVLILEFSY